MDVSLLLQFQYALPVGIVVLCAMFVYAFGFKNAEQPPFAQLSAFNEADRKQPAKKRGGKIKEKRSTNPQSTNEKLSPAKKSSPAKIEQVKKAIAKSGDEIAEGKLKERKQEDDESSVMNKEKNRPAKAGKENKVEQTKNKKNLKNLILEKPLDFDEGDWEQAYSRKDKKNKKKDDETPSKKSKKNKKSERSNNEDAIKNEGNERTEAKDKIAKETENKELKEKNQKDVLPEAIVLLEKIDASNMAVKEKFEKIATTEKEETKATKLKKAKKRAEETVSASALPSFAPSLEDSSSKSAKKIEESKKESDTIGEAPITTTTTKIPTDAENINSPAFDELGDVWTETKPQKKSKKKARKDN